MLCYLLDIQVKQKGSERMREGILSELNKKESRVEMFVQKTLM